MYKKIIKIIVILFLIMGFESYLYSTNVKAATSYIITTERYCEIKNVASGKYLNVAGATSKKQKTSKTNVNIYQYEKNSPDQQWKFTKSGNNYYLTPKSATACRLNPFATKPKNGTNVNIYHYCANDKTQMWILEYNTKYNAYVIKSAYNNNLALTVTGNGNLSNVTVANYRNGDTRQLWRFTNNVVTTKGNVSAPAIKNTSSGAPNSTFDSSISSKLSKVYAKCPTGNYWHGKKGDNLYSTNTYSKRNILYYL